MVKTFSTPLTDAPETVESAGPSIAAVLPGEPYNAHTWSGCSTFFLDALERAGCLSAAVGAAVPRLQHKAVAALVPHPNRSVWSFRANANVLQRKLASRAASRALDRVDPASYDTVLQVLALCDLTGRRGKRTVSYNDTNLLTMTRNFTELADPRSGLVRSAIRYEANVYARTDVIFTMSRWAADTFVRDLEIDSSRVEPIGAGINIADPGEFAQKRYDAKNILCVGRDFYRKGGYVLLEAFGRVRAQIPDATLTLIGTGELGSLPAGVENLGFVSKQTDAGMQTIRDAYRRASVFAMPSLWEPFGIAVLEAQAYGLPCVGSDAFAMRETIRDTCAGLVVPLRDTVSLANALVELLRDPAMCAQMGANGRRRQREYYTWDGVAQRIRERLA